MSTAGRFAPMTAELLARKGEARPFNLLSRDNATVSRRDVVREIEPSAPGPRFGSVAPAAAEKASVSPPPKESPTANDAAIPASGPDTILDAGSFSTSRPPKGRRHSVALLVTDGEFEKLGIVAVKKRVNKQQLLRLALDHYLEKLTAEYSADCHCIANNGACCNG